MAELSVSFKNLPPTIDDLRGAVTQSHILEKTTKQNRDRLAISFKKLDKNVEEMKNAFNTAEGMSKSLTIMMSAIEAEGNKDYAAAIKDYTSAAELGILDGYYFAGMLMFKNARSNTEKTLAIENLVLATQLGAPESLKKLDFLSNDKNLEKKIEIASIKINSDPYLKAHEEFQKNITIYGQSGKKNANGYSQTKTPDDTERQQVTKITTSERR